jgi:hypothetical protein
MFCEIFFWFLARQDEKDSKPVFSLLRFPNIPQISFYSRSYGLPIVPEPAGCTPELPGEIIKNTDSWAPPPEIVNQ